MKKFLSIIVAMVLCSVTLFSVQANTKSYEINSGDSVTANIEKGSSQVYTLNTSEDGYIRISLTDTYPSVKVTDSNSIKYTPYYDYSDSHEHLLAYKVKKGDYNIELSNEYYYSPKPVEMTACFLNRNDSQTDSGKTNYTSIDWKSPKGYIIKSGDEGDMVVEIEKDGNSCYIDVTDIKGNQLAPYDSSTINRTSLGSYCLGQYSKKGSLTYHVEKGDYIVSLTFPGSDLCSLQTTITAPADTSVPPKNNSISVILNGKDILFDQPPIIIDGRTLVPLRAIFEALGATVDWNGDIQTVTSQKGNTTVSLTIGSNTMYKNGKTVMLDVPAQLISDRTLVPVRAIAEAFNCNVDWNGETQTVTITD